MRCGWQSALGKGTELGAGMHALHAFHSTPVLDAALCPTGFGADPGVPCRSSDIGCLSAAAGR